MAKPHHDPVLRLRADLQTRRNICDDKGVITRGRKSLRQTPENCFRIVKNRAGLSMHQRRRPDDLASENFSDSLMSKADTKYGNGLVESLDYLFRDTGILRSPRPRRNYDMGRSERFNLFQRHAVVPKDAKFMAHL